MTAFVHLGALSIFPPSEQQELAALSDGGRMSSPRRNCLDLDPFRDRYQHRCHRHLCRARWSDTALAIFVASKRKTRTVPGDQTMLFSSADIGGCESRRPGTRSKEIFRAVARVETTVEWPWYASGRSPSVDSRKHDPCRDFPLLFVSYSQSARLHIVG